MKVRSQAAAMLAVAGVSAQAPSAYPNESSPLSYVTVTVDDCPTASIETMITVTNGVTVTYCPECEKPPMTTPQPTKHTTVYTTVYSSVCPTGLVPVTHTITETCEGPEPTFSSHGTNYVPPGFTTTVKECSACEGSHPTQPAMVTVTEPCDCEATSGTSMGPAPTGTPVQQISDGQVQVPATGTGSQPAPSGGNNGGDSASDMPPAGGETHVPTGPANTAPIAAPYPTPSTTVKCPGPQCVATGTGAMTPPADSTTPAQGGSTPPADTGMTPPAYQGSASSYGQIGVAALSIVIGTLAFAL